MHPTMSLKRLTGSGGKAQRVGGRYELTANLLLLTYRPIDCTIPSYKKSKKFRPYL